ncbi:Peptidyl-prolyl cis-trans isomerase cyp8 [Serendipita sp. 399]|nr:Peptidyl-prolyl cis-trans isomerase cyp8 [Serendipita sp. 399]
MRNIPARQEDNILQAVDTERSKKASTHELSHPSIVVHSPFNNLRRLCARGTLMELGQQHKNVHPTTNQPLEPSELIHLHYHRNADNQMHDPVSFKPFSEHSHIVALATTGNVYLAESLKNMGGRDAIDDSPFKKSDVITLQNPHGVMGPPKVPIAGDKAKAVVKKQSTTIPTAKGKGPDPYNVSPYSSGLPGASLTSTSLDPHTATTPAMFDEEELMFDAIQNPLKAKKDKDLGKRRAYVRVVTSLGGSLNLELYCEKARRFLTKTIATILTLTLAMANKGKDTNTSQWYITFRETPHLDNKHTVFGKLVGGEDVLDALEQIPTKPGTDRPSKPVKITEVIIHADPFEEYKQRLAKKLAHQAQESALLVPSMEKRKRAAAEESGNWFGEAIKGSTTTVGGGAAGSSIGKYLKRTRDNSTLEAQEEPSKKRKVGWGDFSSW